MLGDLAGLPHTWGQGSGHQHSGEADRKASGFQSMDSLGKYAANTGILATLAAVVPQHPT